ncbi:two-component system, OmpR family, sensor histidine kinase QseC [Thiohalospira halophila DSM 15071]|uniref:histidine kinase n=1 Tax=Thiohalospira halophila DSM 15071 TaxID=1123397 RepID=A0A1I1NDS4_9GAMM|nr:sensor histidine kinase [Thiohalospira halophila]SFC92923.1 two-component system, OmpR family, sensor histidine kinase QseC [Thiohalospira halophila DSM 15071]
MFWIIGGTLALVWTVAAAWIFVSLRAEVNEVLDTKLAESAHMVQNLWEEGAAARDSLAGILGAREGKGLAGRRSEELAEGMACQVWSLDGELLSRSDGAPERPLGQLSRGFADVSAQGTDWRIFAAKAEEGAPRVLVGERQALRDRLANRIAAGLSIPFLLALPALALAIGFAVRRGLIPLREATERVECLDTESLESLDDSGPAPREVAPLMGAIDGLLVRLRHTVARERRFLADAAHQLRTPLAALRTQAQVAREAPDKETRERALDQVVRGTDRADRLMRQLLTLARFDEDAEHPDQDVDLGSVVADAVAAVRRENEPFAGGIELHPPDHPVRIRGDGPALEEMVRNLLENAVQYGSSERPISVRLEASPLRVTITDHGPGLPPEERKRVMERFYRPEGSPGSGSGLGLPVANRMAALHGGRVRLEVNPEGHGLMVVVDLAPAPSKG